MILAGGYGKRLKPVTEDLPKPLVEIGEGYTIMDKQLFSFKSAEIGEVYLLTGYLHEKIEERYGDEYKGVKLHYIEEEKPLGTLNAIRSGLKESGGDVIVSNGDIVSDVGLKRMLDKTSPSGYPVSVFITKMRSPYGVVEIDGDRIKSFKEKPLLDYYINGGIYYIGEEGAEVFSKFDSGDVEDTVFPELARKGELGLYIEDDVFWAAIDTPRELAEARKEYEKKVDKPWGYEKTLINTEKYLTKELFLREGYCTSYHLHDRKDETMYITRGSGYIEFDDHKEHFKRNDTIRIKPKVAHSIVAAENTILQEVSTPHPEDTKRLKDFYTR